MSEELLLLIGGRIKDLRQQKNITLDQLAGKAGVSKALISQVENNRTVPSLPVLLSIVHSLGQDLTGFFDGLDEVNTGNGMLIIRAGEGAPFEKEPAKGFYYTRLFTRNIYTQTVDVALLALDNKAERKRMITTDAWECKHVLEGKIEYQVEKEKVILQKGDTLFFDGRKKHRLSNAGQGKALLLIFYFF